MTHFKKVLVAICILAVSQTIYAQSLWSDSPEPQKENQERRIIPAAYRTFQLEFDQLKQDMAGIPMLKQTPVHASETILVLPMPDGGSQSFKVVEAPVMSPELSAKFPQMHSYLGQGIEDRTLTLRFSITQKGFNAIILGADKTAYIDPYAVGDTENYIVYWKSDFYANTSKVFEELAPIINDITLDINKFDNGVETKYSKPVHGKKVLSFGQRTPSGTDLRTYRLALAGTGEYTAFHGGTVAAGLAAMVVSMTRVNGVYERDLSIHMEMVSNNNLLVYTNSTTDPYTNGNGGTMLGQNISNCNAVIGSANYDIGHVFSTGGGGVAYLGVPCTANKAGGVTGQSSPIGDPFDIDYVCHEMGHQFGGNHTQNNNCNRSAGAAFEPGSASTIMGYAGICAPNLQSNSDDHFHNHSYNEMVNYSQFGNGNNCPVITPTGNTPPDVDVGAGGFFIPIQTPFELTPVSFGDVDGDPLTFNWEEYDLGPATAGSDVDLTNPSGNQPVFRSWPSSTSPTRVFPRIPDLVNNTTTIGEYLADYSRDFNFKCTVRDNNPGAGGVNDDLLTFQMSAAAGPFLVLSPNTAVTYPGNTIQTVTWDVSGTDLAPVNCANVDIFLSLDGGYTWPVTLVSNVPNDGSQDVLIPAGETSAARIKVKGSGNVFFDISNTNFTVGPAAGTNDYDIGLSNIVEPSGDYCASIITPQIDVTNYGAVTLTSFDVTYDVDGGTANVYNWTGSLATGLSETIFLPTINEATGPHVYNVTLSNPNGNLDDNPTNNSGSSSFSTVTGGSSVTLTILTDCWGEEVSWDLNDSGGATIESQAANTLGDQTTNTWTWCLASGCYDFIIYDSFGDGLSGIASGCPIDGNYDIQDSFGNVLAQMGAPNYGSMATHNFCVPVGTPGCIDNTACNYDPAATVDDGSCTYPGCTNVAACNYNAAAGCDDGSCQLPDGCTDNTACNFNAAALCDDGSCTYPGCNDTLACNYNAAAGCDDGSCTYPGCNDNTACNFNAAAGCDDGSCTYPGCTDNLACNYNATAGCDDGSCEYLTCAGCTDSGACNYDSLALIEDGSCDYSCLGCTDSTACNYDPSATIDDGTCDYASCSCTGDLNFDGTINVQDLLMLLGDWGCTGVCIGDFNGDSITNTSDMLIFLGVFGTNCP